MQRGGVGFGELMDGKFHVHVFGLDGKLFHRTVCIRGVMEWLER